MDQKVVVQIHSGILLSDQKRHAICDNIDGVGRNCAKWSKSDWKK